MADVFDFLDDVIVQLQFLEPSQCVEILDLQDVYLMDALLWKERERTLILPKLICGSLGIILFSVR